MKNEMIRTLEAFLEDQDFGKNWDGAYQDAVPTLRRYFQNAGFQTSIMSAFDTESRDTELIAIKEAVVVRIPWAEDYQGRSLVDLRYLQIQTGPLQQAATSN